MNNDHGYPEELNGAIIYRAYTLVDITDTGDRNPSGSTCTYQQAQNFNTIQQILSMRGQLILSDVEIIDVPDVTYYQFGSMYQGSHRVWQLTFASDRPDLWANGNDVLYYARMDCDLTPIHTGLHETARIDDVFKTNDYSSLNLYFKTIRSL